MAGPPTEEAAAEVAKYFLAIFPYTFASGDVSKWDEMRGADCTFCAGVRAQAQEYLDARKRTVGGQITFAHAQGFAEGDGSFVVAVRLTQSASFDVDPTGEVVDEPGFTVEAKAEMRVVWSDERWRVDAVDMTVLSKT